MPIKTLKRIPHVTRDRIAIALVCLSFGAFGAAASIGINKLSDTTEVAQVEAESAKVVAKATANGAKQSCERFGNPLRKGLRDYFEDQLHQTEHPDPHLLERLNITPQEARELSQHSIHQLKYDINVRFADVPCDTQYSVPKTKGE